MRFFARLILFFIFIGVAFASDNVIINPKSNQDTVISVNKAGVATETLRANATAGRIQINDLRGPSGNQLPITSDVVLGGSGTASSNIRLHRGSSGFQILAGDDVTAEGTNSTAASKLLVGPNLTNATSNEDLCLRVNKGGTPTNIICADGTTGITKIGATGAVAPSQSNGQDSNIYAKASSSTRSALTLGNTSGGDGFSINYNPTTGSTELLTNGAAIGSSTPSLFLSATNSRVGINTNSPAYTLDVSSSADQPLRAVTSGSGNYAGTFVSTHTTAGFGVLAKAGNDGTNGPIVAQDKDGNTLFQVFGSASVKIGSTGYTGTHTINGSQAIIDSAAATSTGLLLKKNTASKWLIQNDQSDDKLSFYGNAAATSYGSIGQTTGLWTIGGSGGTQTHAINGSTDVTSVYKVKTHTVTEIAQGSAPTSKVTNIGGGYSFSMGNSKTVDITMPNVGCLVVLSESNNVGSIVFFADYGAATPTVLAASGTVSSGAPASNGIGVTKPSGASSALYRLTSGASAGTTSIRITTLNCTGATITDPV